jgi:hypothetical protein
MSETQTFILDLSDALALDESSAAALAGSLQTAGVIHDAPFAASDIETTIRTLQAVTERARQMRPADQDGGAR